MAYIACAGAAVSIVGSIIGASSASKRAAEDAARQQALQKELNSLEATRQAVINPYADTKNLSGLATNLSSMVSNPYANLGVATAATSMQLEQTDQALANTLDTLRDTGSGAGGATALAMAALKSKQGVAADIESQEANNEKLKAQGAQQMQQIQLQQTQRMQDIQMSEGQRVQSAEAAGQQFMFGATEARQNQQLDRVAAQMNGAQAQASQARADVTGSIMSGVSAVGGIASAYASGKHTGSEAIVDDGTPN